MFHVGMFMDLVKNITNIKSKTCDTVKSVSCMTVFFGNVI